MSEARKPVLEWISKETSFLPGKQGKKVVKIELFPAMSFREKCHPSSKCRVFPLIRKTSDLSYYYRLRINGVWLKKEGYDYYFLTKTEALEVFANA
jgi:hypothetical protein